MGFGFGFRGFGFNVLGFKSFVFRGLGFKSFVFRGLGFKGSGLGFRDKGLAPKRLRVFEVRALDLKCQAQGLDLRT